MQTFLPFADFEKSARVLDRQRLGRQRVECKQILNAMYFGGGWSRHPAVRMWRGHGGALVTYYDAICDEWKARGYRHEMDLGDAVRFRAFAASEQELPPWLGFSTFHNQHTLILLKKMPEHYEKVLSAPWSRTLIPRLLWPVGKDGQVIKEYRPYVRVRAASVPRLSSTTQKS